MPRLLAVLLLALACAPAAPEERPAARDSDRTYVDYLRGAPEFRPVRQDPALAGRWDTWLYMPWRYRWTIGTGDEAGRFCRDYGINGGFTDHGEGPLAWLERWHLRFYNDHTAGKGDLYLQPGGLEAKMRDPRALRPRPLDAALIAELSARVAKNVRGLRRSPMRVAYALDDETSWGSFTRPAVWRIHGDDAAYQRWLDAYYGSGQAPKAQWVSPDALLGELAKPLRQIDLSPLLDRMTWNDSVWANALGELVERCNREDPATPCGIVGAQAPSLWGGYDYAKLAKKVQFIEAYDLGSAQEILRSFDRANALPRVTTHFHDDRRGAGNDAWLAWHYFAHGNRGMIGWVDEGWFEGAEPRPWLGRFAETLRELGTVQGPRMAGARHLHDGIAIYYSHPSVQVSWLLDSEAHGKTWANRNDDFRLGTSHNVRKAWELLLADAGLRYDFLAYDEVALHGVPAEYRVLILPACYALSDAEARRIAAFAESGGTVIADFACGLFDPHGRGRESGALDTLFGVRHGGGLTRAGLFSGRLWVETDQDAGYGYKRYRELFETLRPRLHQGYAVAERDLPAASERQAGKGLAVYLNLSPQRYLMERQEGTADAERRRPFLDPIRRAGVTPWIEARSLGRPIPLEVTYWSKGDRTLVFVLQNVPISGSATGGGGAEGLVEARVPIEVRLAAPVAGARDERTGRPLPAGGRFSFELDTAEAVFFSFAGPPPRGTPPANRNPP
ncbi:MAG TPA: beta-galactosidase trimerization domain-containing protein [Thermoanaerobaculia bacterium]|nr:beta-galactosidase trimerization domain-containing protein [Thermoanaerobaculia bacterium]